MIMSRTSLSARGRPFRLQEAVTDPADDEGLRALRSFDSPSERQSHVTGMFLEVENSGDGP